jgi:hypothetical protein
LLLLRDELFLLTSQTSSQVVKGHTGNLLLVVESVTVFALAYGSGSRHDTYSWSLHPTTRKHCIGLDVGFATMLNTTGTTSPSGASGIWDT